MNESNQMQTAVEQHARNNEPRRELPLGVEQQYAQLQVFYTSISTSPNSEPLKYPHFSSSAGVQTTLNWSPEKARSFRHMISDMERLLPFTLARIKVIEPLLPEFKYDSINHLIEAYESMLACFFSKLVGDAPPRMVQQALFKIRMAVDLAEGVLEVEYNIILAWVFGDGTDGTDGFARLSDQGALPRIRETIERDEAARREKNSQTAERRRQLNMNLDAHLRQYDLQRDRELQQQRWPRNGF